MRTLVQPPDSATAGTYVRPANPLTNHARTPTNQESLHDPDEAAG